MTKNGKKRSSTASDRGKNHQHTPQFLYLYSKKILEKSLHVAFKVKFFENPPKVEPGFRRKVRIIYCPRRVLAQTAKTRGGILEVRAY